MRSEPAPLLAHDWDDLRFFLAVAREGTLSAAAPVLGVAHTTVSRRLSAFEARLGVRLFERLPAGWTPTPAGEEVRRAAECVEREMADVDRRVLGRDARLSGTIRLALPDLAAVAFLEHWVAFGEAFPDITLELVTGTAITNLTRREADVALRLTARPPEHLVGRRVAELAYAPYVARSVVAGWPEDADWTAQRWVGWDETVPDGAFHRWMRERAPEARVAVRVNSPAVMVEAVRAGAGVGLLPCGTADRDAELVRLAPPEPSLAVPLWLLTHRDLRDVARVRAFLDFTADRLVADRPHLEGRASGSRR